MKILEVLDCFYPNYDGPVEVAVNLARKFGEMGLGEMHLLVPDYPERAAPRRARFRRFTRAGKI